jgi:hypothetical protein
MNNKVTKNFVNYRGGKPNLCIPKESSGEYRYILGKEGKNPLVAICMNPSAANLNHSDRTVNKIIKASEELSYDGWIVFNVYPERATKPNDLGDFNEELSNKNINKIIEYIEENKIKEVWGAWGVCSKEPLVKGKKGLLKELKERKIKIFTFAKLTKSGDPVHLLCRRWKQDISKEGKRYINSKLYKGL